MGEEAQRVIRVIVIDEMLCCWMRVDVCVCAVSSGLEAAKSDIMRGAAPRSVRANAATSVVVRD